MFHCHTFITIIPLTMPPSTQPSYRRRSSPRQSGAPSALRHENDEDYISGGGEEEQAKTRSRATGRSATFISRVLAQVMVPSSCCCQNKSSSCSKSELHFKSKCTVISSFSGCQFHQFCPGKQRYFALNMMSLSLLLL